MRSCIEGSIRLDTETTPLEGRLEVCVNEEWGTVNADFWDYRDAIVACRQLNFSPLGIFSIIFAIQS